MSFIDKWKDQNSSILKRLYPTMSDEEIDIFLDGQIKKNFKDRDVVIHNNYENKKVKTSLSKLYDWNDRMKPIIAGFGCFYKNQNVEPNPAALMLDNFMKLRKVYKNKMYTFPEGSFDFEIQNMLQGNEKTAANSLVK